MAVFTGPRIRTNNVYGTLTDNPLTSGATTMNSAGLANLAAVSSAHAVIVLDPLRAAGAPEVAIVTAHTGSATSATITRGAYGTSARQHAQGVLWVHAPTIDDVIRIVTSSTRPADVYEGQVIYETDTDAFKAHNGTTWEHMLTLGAWPTYTPTLTQSVTVTKSVGRAEYTLGPNRLVTVTFRLGVTSSGTASNNVLVGLPVAAASSSGNPVIGCGWIFDTSATTRYEGSWTMFSTTAVGLVTDATADQFWGVTPNTALANGDIISGTLQYQAAA